MKICIITSFTAVFEPRAPIHALAAKRAFPDAEVIFIDCVPAGHVQLSDPPLLLSDDIKRISIRYPSRKSGIGRLALRKIATRISQFSFALTGKVSEGLFGIRAQGLTRILRKVSADIYIAHGVDTLLPSMMASESRAMTMFDCMEYYSDMGDSQSPFEASATKILEKHSLRQCALVIASSDSLADTLANEYGIQRPLPSYNVPPITIALPSKRGGGLNLYWRNSVIGFGQRGLDDVLVAMSNLPSDVRLFLQGVLPADGGKEILERAAALGISSRVSILPPYAPQNAISEAAIHDVGLCLERKGPRNHDLTVSNKMFDYHMAGLAVISSDLPSLRQVIERSGGGLLFEPGNPVSLAASVLQLYSSPSFLSDLQRNARRFALKEGNLEVELERLANAIKKSVEPRTT